MSINNIWRFLEDGDLKGYTLIIPSVAVGNAAQLACDLLISTLSMKKMALVYSRALIPTAGYDPYDLKCCSLSSCCEVYRCSSKNVAVMQLRAPLVYKYAREFLIDVVKTFKQKQIKDIVILTSSFAHEKKHIQTLQFRYVASDSYCDRNKIKALNWLEHDGEEIRGGGFASMLYHISNQNSLPCLILYKYCSEGDNVPDAYDLVHHLTEILPLFMDKTNILSKLIQPVSWKLLFGRPAVMDIY